MILTKQDILKFIDKTHQLNANYYKHIHINDIENNTLQLTSLSQLFYHIYYDLHSIPLCEHCQKELKFISFKRGYENFCSKKCFYAIYPEEKKHHQKTYQKYTLNEKDVEWFRTKNNINYLDTTSIPHLSFTKTPTEFLYCYINIIITPPLCQQCQSLVPFLSFEKGYQTHCSSKCAANNENTKFKKEQTCLHIYQETTPLKNKEIKEKIKETNLQKYGETNPMKTTPIKEKLKQAMMEKFGVENYFSLTEERKLYEQRRIESIRNNCLIKYNKNWVLTPKNIDYNLTKRKKTCLNKYGVEHYVWSAIYQEQSKEITKKIRNTKKANGTINSSKQEEIIYNILLKHFKIVHRNYQSEVYPFSCDFYIEDIDMYVEYQGYFTHGLKMFQEKRDRKQLEKWKEKAKTSDFFKNAIIIWTQKDVLKREIALKNNLKFLEIFKFSDETNLLKQIQQVLNGLTIDCSKKELKKEFDFFKNKKGNLQAIPIYNKIVKYFQQEILFKKENELFKYNPIIRRKIIENRMKYLNKRENELTTRELLSGFKISGLYNSYSLFSPFWFKWFIETYDVKKVYDPFGGWGNRLLGGLDLELYIYNDLNKDTYNNVVKMVKEFDIKHCVAYNEDTMTFQPKESYEAIFTCPPYDDLEDFGIKNDFPLLMKSMITNCYLNNKVCHTIAIVIKENFENLLIDILGDFKSKTIINSNSSHFKNKKNFEYLYVWEKY